MKSIKIIAFILFAFLTFASEQPCVAAIPIASAPAAASSAAHNVSISQRSEKATWLGTKVSQIKHVFHPEHRAPNLGKLALVFGICGFIPIIGWMPAIAAIILGAIGHHKKKEDKRALVGMILGIVSLTLGIIIVAAVLITLAV